MQPLFKLASRSPLRAQCTYCDREFVFEAVGCSSTRHYHPPESVTLRNVRPDHLVFLRDEAQASALGFTPAGVGERARELEGGGTRGGLHPCADVCITGG